MASDIMPRIAALEEALARGALPEIFEQLIAIVPEYEPSTTILERIAECRGADAAAQIQPLHDADPHLHVV